MYLLSGVYGLVFGLRGVVESFSLNPAAFYLIGRTLTALMGTATIAVAYALGAGLYGIPVGLLAAALFTVDLLHVRDSHYITTDVPLTFLLAVAVLFATRYWRQGRRRDAWWSGLFAGLAASMKYPGALALLALLVAHLGRRRTGSGQWRAVPSAALAGAGGLAAMGFLAGTPYAVLTPVAFVRGVLAELREVNTVQFGNEADMPGYLFHLLHSFPEGMGLVAFGLALVGVAIVAARPGWREGVFLAFPLPYFLVIGTWSSRFERYVLPLLPFLAVLAAVACVRIVEAGRERVGARLGRPVGPAAVWLAAAAALIITPEAARVAHWHVLLARPDTREVAGRWIEREIPAGARIAMEPYSPAIAMSPAMIRAERERLGGTVAEDIARRRYDRFLASPLGRSERGYWLSRLNVYDLDRLLAGGVQYVVLSGFTYERYRRACDRYPEACRFYRELERRSTLVYAIDPGKAGAPLWVGDIYSPLTRLGERERPGPPIRIYRLPAS